MFVFSAPSAPAMADRFAFGNRCHAPPSTSSSTYCHNLPQWHLHLFPSISAPRSFLTPASRTLPSDPAKRSNHPPNPVLLPPAFSSAVPQFHKLHNSICLCNGEFMGAVEWSVGRDDNGLKLMTCTSPVDVGARVYISDTGSQSGIPLNQLLGNGWSGDMCDFHGADFGSEGCRFEPCRPYHPAPAGVTMASGLDSMG